jgi:hypothetical protein
VKVRKETVDVLRVQSGIGDRFETSLRPQASARVLLNCV